MRALPPLERSSPVVSTSRLLKVVTAVLIAVLALGACSARPGTAAVVDGRTITEAELAAAATELNVFLNLASTDVLAMLILVAPRAEVATENGLTYSDDTVQQALADAYANAGHPAPARFAESTLVAARSILLDQQLSQSQFAAEVRERAAGMDVELNPRYGTWTPGGPVQVSPEWIYVDEPVAQPA